MADERDYEDPVNHSQRGRKRNEDKDYDVGRWGSNTPSGRRGGVDTSSAVKRANRARQIQQVERQDRVLREFEHTQFVGHITDKISFNRNGDVLIQIQVPYEFKELAMSLTDAFGIPLSFDVEVWELYKQEVDEG